MDLVLVGLDYKTAPITLREQFYLADDALRSALANLRAEGLEEVAIVSTCNRLEIYGLANEVNQSSKLIINFLAHSRNANDLLPHLFNLQGHDVAEHLMRVASGLESQILGEEQILGQVSHALEQAQKATTGGPVLSRLFTAALHAGKRARTETEISRHTQSISYAAVLLIKQQIELFSSAHILVIGAGQMAELAVKALQAHGAAHISLINRTDAKAQSLAEKLNVDALAWDNLLAALEATDVVIAATSTATPLIRNEHLPPDPPLLIDIGLPRNMAPDIKTRAEAHLYDIDDLQNVVEVNRTLRQSEITSVEAIIETELEAFADWLRTRAVVPLITELRLHAESLAQVEIDQALRRLPEIDAREQEIITQMAHRIVNKLLHAPTVNLKSRAMQDFHSDYAHAIRELFSLDEHKEMECMKDE